MIDLQPRMWNNMALVQFSSYHSSLIQEKDDTMRSDSMALGRPRRPSTAGLPDCQGL